MTILVLRYNATSKNLYKKQWNVLAVEKTSWLSQVATWQSQWDRFLHKFKSLSTELYHVCLSKEPSRPEVEWKYNIGHQQACTKILPQILLQYWNWRCLDIPGIECHKFIHVKHCCVKWDISIIQNLPTIAACMSRSDTSLHPLFSYLLYHPSMSSRFGSGWSLSKALLYQGDDEESNCSKCSRYYLS